MRQLDKTLYTARMHTAGGRDGAAGSDDGRLDVKLFTPGSAAPGTNPEQLLAAGWSACFLGALQLATGRKEISLSSDASIDAEVDLCLNDSDFFLQARLDVSLPGLEPELRKLPVAHQTCPSKAPRGNINVAFNSRTTVSHYAEPVA